MIDHINKTRACHVLTIEDPVEFVHAPQKAQITHREIGPHASTLRARHPQRRARGPERRSSSASSGPTRR